MNDFQTKTALKKLLLNEKLNDVMVTGFIERESSHLTFHPMWWWIYIQFESCYLRCQSVNQWFLTLDIAKEIVPQFDVEPDEFCIASIHDAIVFNSHQKHKIVAFHCLLDKDCDLNKGKVKAGGFYLENRETLFFDPSSENGIRIGSKEQVYHWTSLLHHPMADYTEEKWEFV